MKYQPPFDPSAGVTPPGIHNTDPDAGYSNGNAATGEEGSIPPAEAIEHAQREIVEVIEFAGITPDHEDLTQLRQAIQSIALGTDKIVNLPGGIAVYKGFNATSKKHEFRPLKAGANINIAVDPADGNIKIDATTGGGGGGGSTISGQGVEIDVGGAANLAYERLTATTTLNPTDTFAVGRADPGTTHLSIAWEDLQELIAALVTSTVATLPATDRTNILKHSFTTGSVGSNLHVFGNASNVFQLPDVDLRELGGGLTVTLHGMIMGIDPMVGRSLDLEISLDGGTNYFVATPLASASLVLQPVDMIGGFTSSFVTLSSGAIAPRVVPVYGSPVTGAGGVTTAKVRLRYSGTLAQTFRLSGYRYLSAGYVPPSTPDSSGGMY